MLKTYFLVLLIGWQSLMGLNLDKLALNIQDEPKNIAVQPELISKAITTKVDEVESLNPAAVKTVRGAVSQNYIKKIKDKGITLHPGSEFVGDDETTDQGLEHCATLVYQTLEVMPEDVTERLKNLTLYFNSSGRRGLGGGSTIILRCQNVTDEELVSVLVHELGHIKDTGVLKGDFWAGESEFKDGEKPIFKNDLSLDFYRVSFANEKALKKGSKEADFVSGYAMSDPFEDFAETYNFYILHGEQFRKLIENNEKLASKYAYMRDTVFGGREYENYERISYDDELSRELLQRRNYDSTVLDYNLKKFLAI